MFDNPILEICRKRKKNLWKALVDWKAFDSVSPFLITECMEIYKINPIVSRFVHSSMSKWKANITLVYKQGVLEARPISIERGIFQVVSVYPHPFTMSLNQLSENLQKTGYGYQLDEQAKFSFLLYVDDLKLYGTNSNQLNGLDKTIKMVSDDIKIVCCRQMCQVYLQEREECPRRNPATRLFHTGTGTKGLLTLN